MKLFSSKKDDKLSNHSFLIEDNDLLNDLVGKKGTSLFMGKYALNEVEGVLRKRNFYREAQKRSLWPLKYLMDSSNFPPLQRLQIFYKSEDPEHLIVDLKIREGHLRIKNPDVVVHPFPEANYLILEWLTLQNPLQRFVPQRTPLPGQKYPGLGIGHKLMDLFAYLARINGNDGILAFPAYFHNALLFSRGFQFLNPFKEGEMRAVRASFPKVPFKELAWIVYLNCVVEEGRGIYEWKAEEQIHPLSRHLRRYFESAEYKNAVKKAARAKIYTIDWEKFSRTKKAKLEDRDWLESV